MSLQKPYGMGCTDLTQLEFYPPNWVETLTIAKGFWHLFLAMVFAFLKCHDHKNELQDCLMRAIAAVQNEGTVLEPDEYL